MSLHIGILACDHVDQEYIAKFGDYPEMFTKLVKAQETAVEISVYSLVTDQFPEDINISDAYIITGSRFGVYEDIPWIYKAKRFR